MTNNLFSKSINVILLTSTILTILVLLVPLYPNFPAGGLDPSWSYALNQSTAQDLIFGTDIIFTFGPYASIYTVTYHPATDSIMVLGNLFLAICYAGLLILLVKNNKSMWLLPYLLFIATCLFLRDILLFLYPLTLSLVIYRIALPSTHFNKLVLSHLSKVFLGISFLPLSLLILIKGSFLMMCVPVSLFSCLLLWCSKERILASLIIIIPFMSLMLFWVVVQQPLLGLLEYFINLSAIISGYTEAMSVFGNKWEIILYILTSALFIYYIATNKYSPTKNTIYLVVIFSFFLFSIFKAGFVRHDGHAIIATTCMVITSILIAAISLRKSLIIVFTLSLLTFSISYRLYINVPAANLYYRTIDNYVKFWNGLHLRLTQPHKLEEIFYESLKNLQQQFFIPKLEGTTDIYSYDQSFLLASDNTWSPRPIFQSYSAYTKKLAALNAKHIQHQNSPDNILFRIQPIDQRLPALEDGLSWPVLINNYHPTNFANDTIFFKKRKKNMDDLMVNKIYDSIHRLDEEVTLPDINEPLFAEIELHLTFLGEIISFLFKPSPLHIETTIQNESQKKFRLIANMSQSLFLISPQIEDTMDFLLLTSDNKILASKQTKNVKISTSFGNSLIWKETYTMKLYKIDLLQDADINALLAYNAPFTLPLNRHNSSSLPTTLCEGSIDSINGINFPFSKENLHVDQILSVNGWLGVSAKQGIVPDNQYISLTDPSGKRIYFSTTKVARDDVKQHFKQPNMPDIGFTSQVDVSQLKGKYELGLVRFYQGKFETCSQFNIPLIIN